MKDKEHNSAIYLHIGNNRTVRERDVIGIFDMDTATVSSETRKFLRNMEKKGKTENVKEEIPKSFLLYRDMHDVPPLKMEKVRRGRDKSDRSRVSIIQLSSKSVLGRIK
ncbi:MAG: hypothetical protein IKT70_04090 [Clostridia bacterium]|nr:hypothetical protein [Clostridia bacterium]